MLLDQEMLKLVFGVKLRSLRVDKGFSLKDLSRKTGLSPSYLNEIENGKKYPKGEKILALAEALNEKYEDLVSLELKKDLQILQTLLEKNILSAIPFDVFGIPVSTVFQLLVEKPKRMRALIGTLLEIARAHHISVDDLYHAFLRSYLDMHQNYFPSIEAAAKSYRAKRKIDWRTENHNLKRDLIALLASDFSVTVNECDLQSLSPHLDDIFYFVSARGQTLNLSKDLDEREQIFILARELGYASMELKTRPTSSWIGNLDSFEQLFNHFSAGYFASSLLVPEEQIISDLKDFFAAEKWTEARFEEILRKYPGPVESLFHRITQILPRHFGIKNLFYLRYEFDVSRGKYEIARELHLANLAGPHRVHRPENYCSRWLIHKLTQARLQSEDSLQVGVQRSHYFGTENEFLILGCAFLKPKSKSSVSSVCLGILVNEELAQHARWLNSEGITQIEVGETCERCGVRDCESRKSPLIRTADPMRSERIQKFLNDSFRN